MRRTYRRNDFMARPPEFKGPVTRGVERFPGFHTADAPEATYAYAQVKAVPDDLNTAVSPDEVSSITIPDYPVVVALDMQGMKRHVDYDAVEFVKPKLVDLAKEIMKSPSVVSGREEPFDELDSWVEGGWVERDPPPEEALAWLFEYGADVTLDPSGSLRAFAEDQDDPNEIIARVASDQISDEELAIITGQFRYVDDVSAGRIVRVDYLVPWWPKVLDWEGYEEEHDLFEPLEEAGWNIVSMDEVLSGSLSEATRNVYRRPEAPGARIEYHGTSYLNLLSAAPELDLPIPPHPFAR